MNTGGQEQPGSHVSRIVRMDPKAKFWVLPLVSPRSGLHTPVTEGSYSKLLGGTRQGEGMSCLVSPRPADGGVSLWTSQREGFPGDGPSFLATLLRQVCPATRTMDTCVRQGRFPPWHLPPVLACSSLRTSERLGPAFWPSVPLDREGERPYGEGLLGQSGLTCPWTEGRPGGWAGRMASERGRCLPLQCPPYPPRWCGLVSGSGGVGAVGPLLQEKSQDQIRSVRQVNTGRWDVASGR